MTPKKGLICMKEKNEGRDSMVYDLTDIQKMLKIGRTASYDFIAKAYKEGSPFPVLRVGSMYRIPKEKFDMWPVSYTHLDVYKRQIPVHSIGKKSTADGGHLALMDI